MFSVEFLLVECDSYYSLVGIEMTGVVNGKAFVPVSGNFAYRYPCLLISRLKHQLSKMASRSQRTRRSLSVQVCWGGVSLTKEVLNSLKREETCHFLWLRSFPFVLFCVNGLLNCIQKTICKLERLQCFRNDNWSGSPWIQSFSWEFLYER